MCISLVHMFMWLVDQRYIEMEVGRTMYNPHFDKVFNMCESIARFHAGELQQMKLEWAERKDAAGNVYQIVPLLDVWFK